jgi:hypothetical protein
MHPLSRYADSPLVLVEGEYDLPYYRAAILALGMKPSWRIDRPSALLGDGSDGDALKQYLRYSKDALAARPSRAPVFVLRDWEDDRASREFGPVLAAHPMSKVLQCPSDLANPELDRSFTGIERYLGTPTICGVGDSSMVTPRSLTERFPLRVAPKEYRALKSQLARGFCAEDVSVHLRALVTWLDAQVQETLRGLSPIDFVDD